MNASSFSVWQYIGIFIFTIFHVIFYDFVRNFREKNPASDDIKRLAYSYFSVFWLGVFLWISILILTRINALKIVLISVSAGILINIVVEILWPYIAPSNLPSLKIVSKQIHLNSSDYKGLRLVRFWGLGLSFIYLIVLAVIGWSNFILHLEKNNYFVFLIGVFVTFSVCYEIIFLTQQMAAEKYMIEDVRVTLFIKSLRDVFPVFVIAGSLVILSSSVFSSGKNDIVLSNLKVGFFVLLLMFSFTIPAQYQKGVTRARKFKEYILVQCIKDIDRLGTETATHDAPVQYAHRITLILNELEDESKNGVQSNEYPRLYFSTKNLYEENPNTIRIDLFFHLQESIKNMNRKEWEAHLGKIKDDVAEEYKILRAEKPLVSEWIVATLTIIVSTILTKISENIFNFLS